MHKELLLFLPSPLGGIHFQKKKRINKALGKEVLAVVCLPSALLMFFHNSLRFSIRKNWDCDLKKGKWDIPRPSLFHAKEAKISLSLLEGFNALEKFYREANYQWWWHRFWEFLINVLSKKKVDNKKRERLKKKREEREHLSLSGFLPTFLLFKLM